MEKNDKRMDAIVAPSIVKLIEYMNRENITKDDVVHIICTDKGNYIAVIYK